MPMSRVRNSLYIAALSKPSAIAPDAKTFEDDVRTLGRFVVTCKRCSLTETLVSKTFILSYARHKQRSHSNTTGCNSVRRWRAQTRSQKRKKKSAHSLNHTFANRYG